MRTRALIILSTLGLSGFLVGSGLAQLLAPHIEPIPPRPLARVVIDDPDAPQSLLGFLFAPTEAPPPPEPPPGEDHSCDVPWRLVGTMLDHARPDRSFAAIQTPQGSRLLATSMTHTELTLIEIESESATLERADGRRCEIRMFSAAVTTETSIAQLPAVPAPPSDPRVRRVSSNHVAIAPSLLSSPGALGVHPIPFMRDGELAGVRLVGIRRSSPLAAAGVRNGDIISGVDGQPLRGPDIALAALSRLRSGEAVRVTLERGGQSREMTLSTEP